MSEKLKRYLVFTGSNYYPVGGWDDFKGSFDNQEEAIAFAINRKDSWWQVVDLETGKVIS